MLSTNLVLVWQVIEGRQEDAEEFLTCLLNGISDEMTASLKAHLQAVDAAQQERTVVSHLPNYQLGIACALYYQSL